MSVTAYQVSALTAVAELRAAQWLADALLDLNTSSDSDEDWTTI